MGCTSSNLSGLGVSNVDVPNAPNVANLETIEHLMKTGKINDSTVNKYDNAAVLQSEMYDWPKRINYIDQYCTVRNKYFANNQILENLLEKTIETYYDRIRREFSYIAKTGSTRALAEEFENVLQCSNKIKPHIELIVCNIATLHAITVIEDAIVSSAIHKYIVTTNEIHLKLIPIIYSLAESSEKNRTIVELFAAIRILTELIAQSNKPLLLMLRYVHIDLHEQLGAYYLKHKIIQAIRNFLYCGKPLEKPPTLNIDPNICNLLYLPLMRIQQLMECDVADFQDIYDTMVSTCPDSVADITKVANATLAKRKKTYKFKSTLHANLDDMNVNKLNWKEIFLDVELRNIWRVCA